MDNLKVTESASRVIAGLNIKYNFIRREFKNKTFRYELHVLELGGGVRAKNLKSSANEVIRGIYQGVDPIVHGHDDVKVTYLYTLDKEVYEYVVKKKDKRVHLIVETDSSLLKGEMYREQQELNLSDWVKEIVNSGEGYIHLTGVNVSLLEREFLFKDLWFTIKSFGGNKKGIYKNCYIEILPFDCDTERGSIGEELGINDVTMVRIYLDDDFVDEFVSKREYNRSIAPFLEANNSRIVKI